MIASTDTLPNPANYTPPMQTSLLCAARCKAAGGMPTSWKLPNSRGSAVAPNASSPSKPNELIFNTVFYDRPMLIGSTRIVDPAHGFGMLRLWRMWRHEYDVIHCSHVTSSMTSSMTSITCRMGMPADISERAPPNPSQKGCFGEPTPERWKAELT